jgi:hypothetical protein
MIKKLLAAVIGLMILCTPVNAHWSAPTELEIQRYRTEVKASIKTLYIWKWCDAEVELFFISDNPKYMKLVDVHLWDEAKGRFVCQGWDLATNWANIEKYRKQQGGI